MVEAVKNHSPNEEPPSKKARRFRKYLETCSVDADFSVIDGQISISLDFDEDTDFHLWKVDLNKMAAEIVDTCPPESEGDNEYIGRLIKTFREAADYLESHKYKRPLRIA